MKVVLNTQSSFCKVEYVLESLKHSEEQLVEDEEATAEARAARAAALAARGVDDGADANAMEVEPVMRKQRVSVKHVRKTENAPSEAPTFSVLSLHVQTMLNAKRHHHEIVAITGILHRSGTCHIQTFIHRPPCMRS